MLSVAGFLAATVTDVDATWMVTEARTEAELYTAATVSDWAGPAWQRTRGKTHVIGNAAAIFPCDGPVCKFAALWDRRCEFDELRQNFF